MDKINKYKKYIITFIVVLLVATFGYIYSQNKNVVKVTKVNIENTSIVKSVSASGQITSDFVADLNFRATTKIVNLNISEGQTIEKGFLVATGDSSSNYNSSKALQAALNQAIIDRDQYIEDYASNLEAAGGRETYEMQLQRKRELVNQAEYNYKAQSSNGSSFVVTAPFNGTIVDVYKQANENVTIGESIAKLVDLSSLYFEADVDQEDIGLIKQGQLVEVDLDAYPLPFLGTVENIPQYINETTGTVKVKVKISTDPASLSTDKQYQDPSSPVLYGMVGDIEIITESKDSDQALQFDYIFSDDQENTYIWTVEDEKLVKLPVSVSLEGDIYTDVNEDLSGKTIVIPSDDKTELKEGMAVKISQDQV